MAYKLNCILLFVDYLDKEGHRIVRSTSWREQSGDGKRSNGGSDVGGREDDVCAQLTREGSLGTDKLS